MTGSMLGVLLVSFCNYSDFSVLSLSVIIYFYILILHGDCFKEGKNNIPVPVEVCGLQNNRKGHFKCLQQDFASVQWHCEMLHQYVIAHSGTHRAAAPFCTQSPACHRSLCRTLMVCETPVSPVAVFGGCLEKANRKGRGCLAEKPSKDVLEEGLSPRDF